MLHRLPFKNGQGVVRVSQGFDSPCSVFCIYVLMNCLRSIPRRRATRLTSSSLNVGCASRQQLAQVVQPIPAHTRSVISATRRSISSESRSDPLRNCRNCLRDTCLGRIVILNRRGGWVVPAFLPLS